jgi:N-acetyl-anhydromuramyl-L-alanine amidase AmpD
MPRRRDTGRGNPEDPYRVDRVVATYEGGPASAHYLTDRDGKVYRLVKEEQQAFHAGKGKLPWFPERENKLNATSIGIEMMAIGSKADMKIFMSGAKYDAYAKRHPQNIGFTEKQYESLRGLLADIRARHPEVKADRRHVVAHSDYAAGRRTDLAKLFDWGKIGLPKEPGK